MVITYIAEKTIYLKVFFKTVKFNEWNEKNTIFIYI